jgi:hypothetical protein
MVEKTPTCPHCEKSDQVIKVNRIYMESISNQPLTDESIIPRVLNWPENKKSTSFRTLAEQHFLKNFKPPSNQPTVVRPVSPDQVVLLFSVVAVFILYQIFQTQPVYLPVSIGVLIVFYAVYFLGRKRILQKFQVQNDTDGSTARKYENAVGRWMSLYYCIRDNGVFDPKQKNWVQLEDLDRYLMEGK